MAAKKRKSRSRSKSKKPRLSLCMIVRDNERILRECLASIKPWVDEMVVVDTGSKDETPQIARRLGARVSQFPWCDDFAKARNESLRHARGDWIFWMDSDDTIDEGNGRKLRELADRPLETSPMAYVMQVHCPGARSDGRRDVTVVDHVKMFRNRPELRFEGRIHEQILAPIRNLNGEIAWTDVFVVHSGSDQTPEGRQRKQERDLRLLRLDAEERPDHPFVLFNLGMTYADMNEHAQAVEWLNRSLEVSQPGESHLRKAYALLVNSLSQRHEYEEAWRVCQHGRNLFADDPELLFREGMLHHHFGRWDQAEASYLAVLDLQSERHFTSIDRGILGFKTRHNLAIVYQDMGRLDLAEAQWRQIAAEVPDYRAGWHGLGRILLNQNKLATAEIIAEQLVAQGLDGEAKLLQSQIAGARQDPQAALAELRRARDENPDDLAVCEAWCQAMFEHGAPHEAEVALLELIRRRPNDASTFHNLGTVYMRMERFAAAAELYRQSLHLRPHAAGTYLQLGEAYRGEGQWEAAVEAFDRAHALAPDDVVIAAALEAARGELNKVQAGA